MVARFFGFAKCGIKVPTKPRVGRRRPRAAAERSSAADFVCAVGFVILPPIPYARGKPRAPRRGARSLCETCTAKYALPRKGGAKQSKAKQSKARQSKAKQGKTKKTPFCIRESFLYNRNVQMPHGYAGAHPSKGQCALWSLEIRSYSLGSMLLIIATSSSSLMGVDFPFAYSASTRSFIATTKGLCFAMASSPRSLK